MAVLQGQTTRLYSTPYLTIGEYKSAPTAIDYNNLVVDSTDPAVQDAELTNVIARASSWIDIYCNQVLGATSETEQQRVRLQGNGTIIVHPRYFPIVTVSDFWYGAQANQLLQFPDPSQGWVEDQSFVIPYAVSNYTFSNQGALQFGSPSVPRQSVFCRYTYVSGYPSTLLASNASQGASSLSVGDATGILAGTVMTVFDGFSTETVTVNSTYTLGSTTIPLTKPLGFAHITGISVSALPPAVKQAAILVTTAFIKTRGDTSLTMDVINAAGSPSGYTARSITSDLKLAAELLAPFRRIR